jgi:hypothetical protein
MVHGPRMTAQRAEAADATPLCGRPLRSPHRRSTAACLGVKLSVPVSGFGTRLRKVHAWLGENRGADGWAITPANMGGVINNAVAIYSPTPPPRQHS